MGRRKLWPEHVNLSLPAGGKDAMDAALLPGEDRLDLVRTAIDRELQRRGHDIMPPPASEPPPKRPAAKPPRP